MSDTDDDLVPPIYHPHGKIVHSQISNVNKTSYSSYNNMMTSNFNMQNRLMGFDQRSMQFRRETSPMSLRSFPNSRMHYQQPYSHSALSSHNSVYNARCRSPVSVRSISSSVSVNAADIALAFKNGIFNKHELRIIQDAYKKYVKKMNRKRIEKRRNLKSFIKQCRRKSDGESGAEGSNSSISSDDCRSTRSAFCTRNIPTVQGRPPRMDLKRLATEVRENDIYQDCTENFKQNSFRNLLTEQSRTVNHSFMPYNNQNIAYGNKNLGPHQDHCNDNQNAPVLKDRLAKDTSVLLPIQRFNNLSSVNQSYKVSYKEKSRPAPQKKTTNNVSLESDSDEIFTQSTSTVNLTNSNTLYQKRALEDENISYPESKRKKATISPVKRASSKNMKKVTGKTKDFNFKKPLLPISRFNTLPRNKEQEILIAKSSQPLTGNVEPLINQLKEIPKITITSEENLNNNNKQTKQTPQDHINDTINNNTVADTAHNSTDVSMKPSFIKRKLFTQKLDMIDNNNISSDNGGVNSPQKKSQRACREKNKVRKLTSQSCLSRDISDNNYLDLIHKLVPPDQINNQTVNNSNVANNKKTTKSSLEKDDKWDVSLAVSRCNYDNTSDVYTDEEIFDVPQKDKENTKQVAKEPDVVPALAKASSKKQVATASTCKVVLQKVTGISNVIGNNSVNYGKQHANDRTVKSCLKSFWDTDFETDAEDALNTSSQNTLQRYKVPRNSNFLKNGDSVVGAQKSGTMLATQNIHNPGVNKGNGSENTQSSKSKMHDKRHENKEKKDGDSVVGAQKSGTMLATQNIHNPGVNKSNGSKNTQSSKSKMHDKLHENKENNNNNIQNRSTRRNKEANIQTDMKILKSTKSDTNNLLNNSNYNSASKDQNNKAKTQKSYKPKTSYKTKNREQSQTIFNISRESLRKRTKSGSMNDSSPTLNQTKLGTGNTSRESLRLKQKKAKLNGTINKKR